MQRDPALQAVVDKISQETFGRSLTSAHQERCCVDCGKSVANMFRDRLSAKEYTISGLCQDCQDKFFGQGCPDCEFANTEDCVPGVNDCNTYKLEDLENNADFPQD
jgi:hypothetical protein